MLFWIMCAALTLLVAGAILAPFWRRRRVAPDAAGAGDVSAAAFDLRVYRDQLREVDRDLDRGVIGAEDAARLRTEIGRKVLEADRRLAAESAGASRGRGAAPVAALVLLALLSAALAVYLREGAPDQGDLPLAARIAAAERAYASRPTQAEAEKAAPPITPATPDPKFAELIERLREVVAQRPDDPQGQALLAQNEARLGNLDAAITAQQKLIDLRGDQVSAEELAQLAALKVEKAGGLITAESEALLARALQIAPRNPQARYMVGLLQAQNGRPDRTFPIWAELLAEGPEDAPWIGPIRATITDLAWLAGQPDYQPPASSMPGLPGPDAGQVAAAGDMTPEERQQMIAGMVGKLQDRLLAEGGSPEEWVRLIGALKVLGQADKAAEMAAKAREAFAGQAEALAAIEAAASAEPPAGGPMAGGAAPAAPMAGGAAMGGPMAGGATPGPGAADVAAAADMTPEERQQMIAGMVQRLEARLATEGGSPEEWAQLIGSLAVLDQTDHAREIWGEAQARFGSQPEAIAPIRAAAERAGLTE